MSSDLFIFTSSLCVLLFVGMAVSEEDVSGGVHVPVGSDPILPCTARSKPGLQYMAVRWYKRDSKDASTRLGLVTKDLPDGTTVSYAGLERAVELLNDSRSIVLPAVTCADSGVYICYLAAPVGEQNRNGELRLIVSDCPVDSAEKSIPDTYLVILATVVLVAALVTFIISYGCLMKTIKGRSKTAEREISLNAPLKPLDKKDLMSIYTLGPKTSSLNRICV